MTKHKFKSHPSRQRRKYKPVKGLDIFVSFVLNSFCHHKSHFLKLKPLFVIVK